MQANLIDAEICVRGVGKSHRSGSAADLFHRHAVRKIAHVDAAVLFLHRNAVQVQRTHLGPEVAGKFVGAIDLGCNRSDAILRERAHGVAQQVDLGTQAMVEGLVLGCGHRECSSHPSCAT